MVFLSRSSSTVTSFKSACSRAFLTLSLYETSLGLSALLALLARGFEEHAIVITNTGTAANSRNIFSRIRSEEHTSELQSRENIVCRLLLEKKIYNKMVLTSVTLDSS